MNSNNYSGDKAIEKIEEDEFQRYPFAKRIAESILAREANDCLIVGIYGAWGEGKTSVLNLISTEIQKPNVISITFNPWRFSNEDKLIYNFLVKVSKSLNKELESKKEKYGKFIEKYGSITKSLGLDIENIGKSLAEVDLEELKERVNNFLKESKSKLIIFIDDIDRLDRSEIHAIFKLVKLTADFVNTTYILSFDEKMVASAIGEKYGEGNQNAGFNFLEKIIQVPLQIPIAQLMDLKRYCTQLIYNTIRQCNIELSESEEKRFGRMLSEGILPRLKTPRLAVRYNNSLMFSLPLLKNEANTVDLMLIEAIKIFYPKHYESIKNNPYFYIYSYESSNTLYENSYTQKDDKKRNFEEHFEQLNSDLTKNEIKAIKNLLIHLFPLLNGAFSNNIDSERKFEQWYKEKKVSDSTYFSRYFTYSVAKGDISDVEFNIFLEKVRKKEVILLKNDLVNIIDKGSVESFIQKLFSIEEEIDWEAATKLSMCLLRNCNVFSATKRIRFWTTQLSEIARFLSNLIKNQTNNEDSYILASNCINKALTFDFAYDILNKILKLYSKGHLSWEGNNIKKLEVEFLKRFFNECGNKSAFEFSDNFEMMEDIFYIWKRQSFPITNINDYLQQKVKDFPNIIYSLINIYTPTIYTTDNLPVYKDNFSKKSLDSMNEIFNLNIIYEHIELNYGTILSEPAKFLDQGEPNNDENILRQFVHWYKLKIEPSVLVEE